MGILTGLWLADGGYHIVLDLDRHGSAFGDGFRTIEQRTQDLGSLPQTFTVTTPHDGEHRYFRATKQLITRPAKVIGPGLDCKSRYGFVIAPGAYGYTISINAPIAQLPEAWESALTVTREPKQKIKEGERHDYLCKVAFAMACEGKQKNEIVRTLQTRLERNCVHTGREISYQELTEMASSAIGKILRSNETLDRIVA